MKRIVWVAVTVLIMLAIMGFGLHTLNNIEEVNQRRREKEQGEQFASQFAMTTATTSVWDRLRQTTVESISENATEEDISGQTMPEQPEADGISTAPAPQENELPEVITDVPVQTSTVTTGIFITID